MCTRAERRSKLDLALKYLRDNREGMLEDLRTFVDRETPSTEKDLLDDFARFLAGYAAEAGGKVEVLPDTVSGDHVRVRWDGEDGREPILLLGHYDTVWSAGTLGTMPFEVSGGKARGPGVFDMKCGLVQGFWAVKTLRELLGFERPLVFLCNSDEEVGSPGSRGLIEEEARRAAAVLVLEPSLDGALKTARKGVSRYRVHVTGRPSHAGLDPTGGVSAIDELARLVLELHGHSDPRGTGTTVNVGLIAGGTRYNVVAADASAEVDVRAVTRAEAERMKGVFAGLGLRHPEATVSIEGGEVWPPMERTVEIGRLYEHARGLAAELGFDLGEGLAGGASDGCLCAAVGAPVLDGLGAVGSGAHARDEHVEVESIPLRAALVARLLQTL
jgi:glutamate carboxypeptidase